MKSQMLAFELVLVTIWMALFPLLSAEHHVHYLYKLYELWTGKIKGHFCLQQSICEELGPRGALSISGCCLYTSMACASEGAVLTCVCECRDKMCNNDFPECA